MAAMAINFSQILKGIPKGAWVAISPDQTKVIAFGSDLSEVMDRSAELGESDPIVTKVPQSQNALAF